MEVQCAIRDLAAYALHRGLIREEDIIWTVNRIADTIGLKEITFPREDVVLRARVFSDSEIHNGEELEETLQALTGYASSMGLVDWNSPAEWERFSARLMGLVTPPPREVVGRFQKKYAQSPKDATDYLYQLSYDTNYMHRSRMSRDMRWTVFTSYGDLDITINLTKPEKDPADIAKAAQEKPSGYPKCLLCKENEGFAGGPGHPARQNLRMVPVDLAGTRYAMQYSPYQYYTEHCIVLNKKHVPMKINKDTFLRLLDFVRQYPHYFLGSNADLPIVGGSILSHDHFQGGRYEFSMAKAPVERHFSMPGFSDISCGIVKWPMSAIRLSGEHPEEIASLADFIASAWRFYSDRSVQIYAETDGTRHNTVTPIARKRGSQYELDLVLRNNNTSPERPEGIFHPRRSLHHIKKENIGLIEVMGLAILPGRLKEELSMVRNAILDRQDLHAIPEIAKHADWVDEFLPNYNAIDEGSIDAILKKEVGLAFLHVLEDAGVFKRTKEGRRAFERFLLSMDAEIEK